MSRKEPSLKCRSVKRRVARQCRERKDLIVVVSLALGCTTMLNACRWSIPAEERVGNSRDKITSNFKKELARQKSGAQKGKLEVNWDQALEKMYLSNPNLIQADHRIEDAKQRQTQIWRNMLPSLRVGASDSFTIGDISDALSDTSFRINSSLSLGNLLDLPKKLYSSKLSYMGSELQAENAMRQQVIALYRLFQQQRLINLEEQALKLEGELLSGLTPGLDPKADGLKKKHKQALKKWNDDRDAWLEKVGDFYMSGYEEVHLRGGALPDITYRASELDFTNTERWGYLQLNLLALEDVAKEGRVIEAYLRYVPRANLSVSAPPLYSSSSGQSFEFEDIRLSPSVDWSLDSRGSISQQIRRIKRTEKLDDWRKDKRQREEIKKLLKGKKALAEVQEKLAELRKINKGYIEAVKLGMIKDPEKVVQQLRKLKSQEVQLMAREIEISTSFWLIDESRWKKITKRWLETRKKRVEQREKANVKTKNWFKFGSSGG